jgi:hypothetical protein
VSEIQLVQRECGDCQACCTLLFIEELKKPERERCPQQCKKGCSIYVDRPPSCSSFRCRWLQGDPNLERRDRPDRLGVMFDNHSALKELFEGIKFVVAREVRPGAFKHKRAARWVSTLAEERLVVQISYFGKRKVVGPRALVEEFERRNSEECAGGEEG